MTKEFDIYSLLGIGSSVEPSEGQDQQLTRYDYEQERTKVRCAYVDLLDRYGTSTGEVIEERKYPKPRFSLFRITSRRKCPEISEVSRVGESSLGINLESLDHSEPVAKPYDPATLTQVFPDDTVRLHMSVKNTSSPSREWEERTFYIFPESVSCYRLSNQDFPLPDLSKTDEFMSSRKKRATPEELETLLLLAPFLESRYQNMRSSLPPAKKGLPNPRPRFLKWFST